GLDRRAAVARQHVDDFFIEVLLRRTPPGRWKIEHEYGYEVAAALEIGNGAVDAEARPGPGLDLEEIDAEILDDRNVFPLGPVDIGIEQQLGMFPHRSVHHWSCSFNLRPIRRVVRSRREYRLP